MALVAVILTADDLVESITTSAANLTKIFLNAIDGVRNQELAYRTLLQTHIHNIDARFKLDYILIIACL